MGCSLVVCYQRRLHTIERFTVEEAKAADGKDDRCRFDRGFPFHFHWDKANEGHELLTLKEPLPLDPSIEQGIDPPYVESGEEVHVHTTFDYDAWIPCHKDCWSVKAPRIILEVLQRKEKTPEPSSRNCLLTSKPSFHKPLSAFSTVPVGKHECAAIDNLLTVLDAESVTSLSREITWEIHYAITNYSPNPEDDAWKAVIRPDEDW